MFIRNGGNGWWNPSRDVIHPGTGHRPNGAGDRHLNYDKQDETGRMGWAMHIKRPIVAALAVAVALVGICMGRIARAELVDRILVVVNDDIILLSELEQVMATLKASLENRGVSSAQQRRILNDQRPKILEKLIRDKLTDQRVARYKLEVSDEEVEATIQRIRDANKLNEEEFRRAVELDGMAYETYRNQTKDQILRSRLINLEVQSKIVITDVDIKKYYDAHIEHYAGHTKYKLRHILLRFPSDASDLQKVEAAEKMDVIRQRLEAGEAFEELAQQFSNAPTAADGGLLGVFGTNLLTKEIRDAIKGLQPKQYSQVVETEQGYQIFFVEDILHSGGKTLEAATPEIRDKLYAEVVDQKFKTWLEDLRKRSHIRILE
jgi:peptidyl-prolyl cis-trans isomerase SurA